MTLLDSILDPIEMRVHCPCSVLLDMTINNIIRCGVVCGYNHGRLRMAHLVKGCLELLTTLTVYTQPTHLCFCSEAHHISSSATFVTNVTIDGTIGVVSGSGAS
eukprot:13460676-Ditylum_brightwellii.AAC.1